MTAIGDTSLLEVFTRIRGLGLLAPWAPVRISGEIVHEHETTAPAAAHAYLLQAIRDGRIEVGCPVDAAIVIPPHHGLSPVDLAGLRWAKAHNEWLLVDDREMCDVARLNRISFLDVPGIVRALRDAGALDGDAVRRVAASIELDGDRAFPPRDRAEFGLA